MTTLIATETRVYPRGSLYYVDGSFADILKRYADAFGDIELCTLRDDIKHMPASAVEIGSMIKRLHTVRSQVTSYFGLDNKVIKNAVSRADLVIARVPSRLAYRAADYASSRRVPYMTECVGCAWDALWNHGLAGKALAPYMYLKMKSVVKHANFASYVTENWLQNKYPCNVPCLAASDVMITDFDENALKNRVLRNMRTEPFGEIRLMTAAAVNVRYKGQEYVIKAIPLLDKMGIKAKYFVAGKGDDSFLKKTARKLNVEDRVVFTGALNRENLMKYLDETDIYVQPSLLEGLPRAVVEAMSRGCPCLGTDTGGIPELLKRECVFKRKSPKAIAEKIAEMLEKGLNGYARNNFDRAKSYDNAVLSEKRIRYYASVKREIEGETDVGRR